MTIFSWFGKQEHLYFFPSWNRVFFSRFHLHFAVKYNFLPLYILCFTYLIKVFFFFFLQIRFLLLLWARYLFSNMLLLACRQAIIFCVHSCWPFILVSRWNLASYNLLPDLELSAPPALSLHLLCSFCPLGLLAFFLPPPISWPFCLTMWHSLLLLSRTSHSVLYAADCFLSFRSELIHPRGLSWPPHRSGITCLQEPWPFTYQAVSTD